MTARRVVVRLWFLLALAAASRALTQDVPESAAQDIAEGAAQGLLPVPDYGADFWPGRPKRGSTITNSATRQREQDASIADETCIERPRSARAKRGAS